MITLHPGQRLLIEPFERQPAADAWIAGGVGDQLLFKSPDGDKSWFIPPRRSSDEIEEWETIVPPTVALVSRYTVERVEARQAKDITNEELLAAGDRYKGAVPDPLVPGMWCWLYWLKEES